MRTQGSGHIIQISSIHGVNGFPTFLQDYLRYVKYRQFPMLLLQVRIGIAERRRSDFVEFVPVH